MFTRSPRVFPRAVHFCWFSKYLRQSLSEAEGAAVSRPFLPRSLRTLPASCTHCKFDRAPLCSFYRIVDFGNHVASNQTNSCKLEHSRRWSEYDVLQKQSVSVFPRGLRSVIKSRPPTRRVSSTNGKPRFGSGLPRYGVRPERAY